MTSLPLIASRLFNTPLMVNPQKAAALIDGLGGRMLGCDVVVARADPVHHVAAEQGRPSLARLGDPFGRRLDENGVDSLFRVGAVAIIGVEGSLTHKGKFLGSFRAKRRTKEFKPASVKQRSIVRSLKSIPTAANLPELSTPQL